MADRLGLAVIPGVGWRASEIQAIAREAEEAGFDAIFAAEVNNDVMATFPFFQRLFRATALRGKRTRWRNTWAAPPSATGFWTRCA